MVVSVSVVVDEVVVSRSLSGRVVVVVKEVVVVVRDVVVTVFVVAVADVEVMEFSGYCKDVSVKRPVGVCAEFVMLYVVAETSGIRTKIKASAAWVCPLFLPFFL